MSAEQRGFVVAKPSCPENTTLFLEKPNYKPHQSTGWTPLWTPYDFWPQKINRNTFNMKTLFGDLNSWHSPLNFTNTLIKHYIWDQRKQKGILSSAHFIIYFKKQVKEWYKAQTMPDSNVNLKFLTKPEYKNIIKQW